MSHRQGEKRYRVTMDLALAQQIGVTVGRVEADIDEDQVRRLDELGAFLDRSASIDTARGDYWPVYWRSDMGEATDPSSANFDPLLARAAEGPVGK